MSAGTAGGGGWARPVAALLAITFVAHLLVLANPGFFSHDEWQRIDHIEATGLWDYVRQYGAVKAGPDFGFPVRPVGFVQQGLSSLFMADWPVVAHLVDVLLHAAVTLLLLPVLLRAGLDRRRSIAVAAVFAIAPLGVFSTAWVGASFERWYVFFGLGAAYGFLRLVREGAKPGWLALVFASSAGAILSKESAIMLPAALVVLFHSQWSTTTEALKPRAALLGLVAASLPVLAYLLVRLPALEASFGGGGGPYSPSIANLPSNALLYLAQPFMPGAVELVSAPLLPRWQWWFALSAHGVLLAAIAWRFGLLPLLSYLAAYFVFLAPVMMLSFAGAHYLYASGIPFALAVGLLLAPRTSAEGGGAPRPGWAALVGVVLLAGLFWRSQVILVDLYDQGRCQSTLIATVDAAQAHAGAVGATRLRVLADPGAREYVAIRAFFNRTPYSGAAGPAVVVGTAEPVVEGELAATMRQDCRVVLQ